MDTTLDHHKTSQFAIRRAKATVAAFLAMMAASLAVALSFLVIPGAQHFGVPVAEYQLFFSILILASGISFFVIGPLIAAIGVRIVLIASGALAAVSLYGAAFASSITVLYIWAIPFGIGVAGSNVLAANSLVAGWHDHGRRGTVLGVVAAGSGVGGVLWGLLLPSVVAAGGFSGGMLFIGTMFVLLSVLPGIFLAHNPPSVRAAARAAMAGPGQRTPIGTLLAGVGVVVPLLALGAFFLSLEQTFGQYQPAVYGTYGFDPLVAGYLVSVYAVCGTLAKPILGYMHDKLGPPALFVALVALFVLGLPALAFAAQINSALILPVLVVSSLSLAVPTVILPLLALEAVGRVRFPVVFGALLAANYVAQAASVYVWGLTFDTTGRFDLIMYVSGAAGLVGLGSLYLAVRLGRSAPVLSVEAAPPVAAGTPRKSAR